MEKAHSILLTAYADQPVSLTCAGTSQTCPGHRYGPAVRGYYVVHYIVAGRGTFQVDGVTYHLHAGQGFLIQPHARSFYIADDQDPWQYVWLGFSGPHADQLVAAAGFTPQEPTYQVTPVAAELSECVQGVLAHPRDTMADSLWRTGQLYQFFGRLAATAQRGTTASIGNPYINSAVTYIRQHIDEHLTVTQLAASVGLNRSYFSDLFRTTIGVPPVRYIHDFRLTLACHYLEASDLPIQRIAGRCGYQRTEVLNHQFKRQYGLAPRDYRQQLHLTNRPLENPAGKLG